MHTIIELTDNSQVNGTCINIELQAIIKIMYISWVAVLILLDSKGAISNFIFNALHSNTTDTIRTSLPTTIAHTQLGMSLALKNTR
ncbi:hypothetical protein FACS1894126_1620 [Alphaproteobacteria bacterium]|nr:hypothetical protein FACS1894126_1620 [Alphaproteobacteria bacterium]